MLTITNEKYDVIVAKRLQHGKAQNKQGSVA